MYCFHNEGTAFNSTKPSGRAVTSDPLHSVTFDKVEFHFYFFLVVSSCKVSISVIYGIILLGFFWPLTNCLWLCFVFLICQKSQNSFDINPSAARVESQRLPLQKGQQSNLVSISSGSVENWGESAMADASPRTDISTDVDTDDKVQRVISLSLSTSYILHCIN